MSLNKLAKECFGLAQEKGFWDGYSVPVPVREDDGRCVDTVAEFDPSQRNFGEVLALIHSELSEALEADRKKLNDDKLSHYEGKWVELADALIRILDYVGAFDIDIDQIVQEKLEYNRSRPRLHGKNY
jgi:hypothetical protein